MFKLSFHLLLFAALGLVNTPSIAQNNNDPENDKKRKDGKEQFRKLFNQSDDLIKDIKKLYQNDPKLRKKFKDLDKLFQLLKDGNQRYQDDMLGTVVESKRKPLYLKLDPQLKAKPNYKFKALQEKGFNEDYKSCILDTQSHAVLCSPRFSSVGALVAAISNTSPAPYVPGMEQRLKTCWENDLDTIVTIKFRTYIPGAVDRCGFETGMRKTAPETKTRPYVADVICDFSASSKNGKASPNANAKVTQL